MKLTWQGASQRSLHCGHDCTPSSTRNIFWPTHLKLPCCISSKQMSWLWRCAITYCLCVPKLLCYCFIRAHIVVCFSTGCDFFNGNFCIGPSMTAPEKWSSFVSIEMGPRACSSCFMRRGCGLKSLLKPEDLNHLIFCQVSLTLVF